MTSVKSVLTEARVNNIIAGTVDSLHPLTGYADSWGGNVVYTMISGLVFLFGTWNTPGGVTDGDPIATLPSGYRPSSQQSIPVTRDSSVTYVDCHVTIQTNGQILVYSVSNSSHLYISGGFCSLF